MNRRNQPEFTVKEYAKREQVTPRTVWNWIAKGALSIRRTPGGGIRIFGLSDGSPMQSTESSGNPSA